MSAPAVSAPAAPLARPDASWLFGRGPDLLLGCGLGYLLSIPILASFEVTEGSLLWPGWLAALLAMLVSSPHYGATILRAYGKREDRRRYVFFTVYATLLLGLLLVAGIHWALLGSALITLYASWAPWHFAGQNYGIALMVLRRRGVEIAPAAKRLLYVSFLLTFVLAFLEIHAIAGTRNVLGIGYAAAQDFRILRAGLPMGLVQPLTVAVAAVYAGSLVGATALLLRGGSLRQIAPAGLLVAIQALWFAVPAFLSSVWSVPLVLTLPFSLVWISAAHSAQYLWVTAYYDRRSSPGGRASGFLWRCLLAGSALLVLPGLLLAPGLAGPVAWDAGLALVLFSVVNLHHFVLDGAIWKLRDGRVARALLRTGAEPDPTAPIAPRGWSRPALAAVGVACLGVALHELWEVEFVYSKAGADAETARAALDRLRWTGRDSPASRLQVGQVLLSQGRPAEAAAEFERSLELDPSAEGFALLGMAHQQQGAWAGAAAAHERALALDPDALRALVQGAVVDLQRAADGETPDALRRQAALRLGRALELRPDHALAARHLARLRAEQGRVSEAIAVLEAARVAAAPEARGRIEADLAELRAARPSAAASR